MSVDNAPRVIAITSAVPGEGKTTTAMNLAAVLAEAGHRVCLVEADLRRPTLASTLGLVADVGLTSVLIGKVPVEGALQNMGRNLAVLTSGPVPPNPSELLASAQMAAVMRDLNSRYDAVIFDAAPTLPVADAAVLAAHCHGVLLVSPGSPTSAQVSP